MYLLPEIHKRLSNVPGRPVISNCGVPTEKVSEFLDSHMQPIMRKGWSYIKDSQDLRIDMNEEVKSVFTPAPMISFRSARKLSSYLVRAKLYPLERTVGSVQCKGKRCQTCHNIKETETFTSATTGKTFKINHTLNCNDKCLVYLLTCNVC